MPDLDRITLVIESLPGNRAQVSVNIPGPLPETTPATAAHAIALDTLEFLGKQPTAVGFIFDPAGLTSPQDQALQLPQAAHIVLDLETLSTSHSACIASIGAVALAENGEVVSEFHEVLDTAIQSVDLVRDVCPKTMAWWDEQSEEARAASIRFVGALHPNHALKLFSAWVAMYANPEKVKVWGNGSSFDNVILSSLYADYPELTRPWAYWNDRDMRTVLDLYPQAKHVGEFEGVKHNALHDARHEAKQLAAVLRAMQAAATQAAAVQLALRDYHYALDTHAHGGVAASKALDAVQQALAMPWEQGKEAAQRATITASDTQGAAA